MKMVSTILIILFCINLHSAPLHAVELEISPVQASDGAADSGLIARVDLQKAGDQIEALRRAEAYYLQEGMRLDHAPLAFVIYGPPVAMFFKRNYSANQQVVDLAAKLTALNVIDVKVCEFSYLKEGLDPSELLPFVTTVPFGPDEVTRLVEQEKYDYF
jgi:intracellular sulfur oxidation DsrE/DsrF family protein